MVGDGDMLDPQLERTRRVVFAAAHPVEQGILGVQVKVRELRQDCLRMVLSYARRIAGDHYRNVIRGPWAGLREPCRRGRVINGKSRGRTRPRLRCNISPRVTPRRP